MERANDSRHRDQLADRHLVRQYRRGQRRAREVMIERYLPYAARLALSYRRGNESAEDLVQVASIGLIKAVDRWDPERGVAFSTFAAPTILGELRRHFRDATWDIRPPRRLQELSLAVVRAKDAAAATGREPTVAQLSDRLSNSSEDVEEALLALGSRRLPSLDAPVHAGDEGFATVGEVVGSDDPGYERADVSMTIASADAVLNARERTVLRLRLIHDLTQSEIGRRLGCSQAHVSRIAEAALGKMVLRTRLEAC